MWQRRCLPIPAGPPQYVLPRSQLLDPGWYQATSTTWPFPRAPWPLETESRAPGTGLIWGPPRFCPPPPPCFPPRSSRW